ncbi:MAG: molybdopterin-dependent oxidoreductase, partial [Candidatus Thorarchaeota archaeon]
MKKLNSSERPKDETTVYTSCLCNCGSISQCVLKAHIKDGVVIAVEPDDRYNTGIGREDEVVTETDLIRVRLQRRACPKGLTFHKYIYRPDRIIYPLKRDPNSKRGEGKYIRISWDEALNTITDKMTEIREKYGPYSIMTPYQPNALVNRLFSFWGAGVDSWGWCSYDATRLTTHLVAGVPGWDVYDYVSGSASDMLANSKLIILWGLDACTGSSGPGYQFAWFIKLARERGKRVIIFDPRYTPAAEVVADQWIPIKPGTDSAMFIAITYMLFKKDAWNKEFVDRYVELEGFKKWQDYVLGIEDGVVKTPEWAETKCAVPAETIRALANLLIEVRPAWLWCHWGVSRKSRGEDATRAFAVLQAMLGYWGTPGAGPPLQLGPERPIPNNFAPDWYKVLWGPTGDYKVPKVCRSHYWAQAVLLLDKVRSGELSEQDYMRM